MFSDDISQELGKTAEQTANGPAYVSVPQQDVEQEEAFAAFSASIPVPLVVSLEEALEGILDRAPFHLKWQKLAPCHAALFDVDDFFAKTEIEGHMRGFRRALSVLLE